jgi:hypothetical protein
MKLNNRKSESIHEYSRIILAGTLATAVLAIAACSTKPVQKVDATLSTHSAVKPASLQVVTSSNPPIAKAVEAKSIDKTTVKQPGAKLLRFKSRDYAVTFEYPWQYSISNAKKIFENDELQPKSDGSNGQIALARIDMPKGFYPDTDFESGYFTLSLNPDLGEQDCKAALESAKRGGARTAKINNTDFFWVESEERGKGRTSIVRNYVSFANDVCYEFELGLKTQNEDGLASEVNADRVMQRLDSILKSVKLGDAQTKPDAVELQSSIDQPKADGQK